MRSTAAKSRGMKRKALLIGNSSHTIIEPLSIKATAPTQAAGDPMRSTRRNQYIPQPAAETLRMAMTVSAVATGRTAASQVRGKSSAVFGLAKNGAPAYAWGFQSGK